MAMASIAAANPDSLGFETSRAAERDRDSGVSHGLDSWSSPPTP